MADKFVNKVVYGGNTLIDLTADTITADKVLSSVTAFHLPDGSTVAGTCTYDVDSSEVTATQDEVLSGKTFAKAGSVLTGSMTNVGTQVGRFTTKDQIVAIQKGYHDGSGAMMIDSTEQAKIIATNIKDGISILGVTGTYTGSELIHSTVANVTPTTAAQDILPTDLGDYNYISEVKVAAIPYTETSNSAGGLTVTIAA